MVKRILTIGGSDPFAGGGIQTDLKTFENHQLFGLSALTSIGILDASGEFILQGIAPELLERQLASIQQMSSLDGIKIGLLHSVENVKIVGEFLKSKMNMPIVLDPVLAFKETRSTGNQEYIEALIQHVFPYATIITPNLREAALLSGLEIHTQEQMQQAAERIYALGAESVVIKGGAGFPGQETIELFYNGSQTTCYQKAKLDAVTVNGAGCAFSSAIASNLVDGQELEEALKNSKDYVYQSILNGVPMSDGSGSVWFGNKEGKTIG